MDQKNLFWYVIVLMVGIFFFSSLALAQIAADIVFTNGKIYTVNNKIIFAPSSLLRSVLILARYPRF
jgi:hypothetical protein